MKVCRLPSTPNLTAAGWNGTTALYFAGNAASSFTVTGPSDSYGAKRYFILAIVLGDSTKSVSAVSLNNFITTQAATQRATFTANSRKIEIWAVANPTGSNSVTVTLSGASDYVAYMDILFGVDLDTPFGAFVTASGTGTAPSSSVSDSEDYALSILATVSESVTRSAGSDLSAAFEPGTLSVSKTTGATNPCSLDAGEMKFLREGTATALPWVLSSSVNWLSIAFAVHRHGRPTSAYTAWRNTIAADRTVLMELEPGELLTGWTNVSGSKYSITWNQFVQTTINGGLRRKLIGLENNGAAYTEVASQAALDATSGLTYFLDTATNTLYYKGGNPDGVGTAVTASFRIHLATREVDFLGGEYYEPRLVGTLPSHRSEAQDLLFGIATYPGGEVQIQNSDACFDVLSASWLWRNRKARAYLGGLSLARTDFKLQSEMLIEDFQAGLQTALVKLRAGADVLQRLVPSRTADTQMSFAANVDGAASAYEPLLIGTVTNIVPQAWHDFGGGFVNYITADSFWLPIANAARAVNRTTGAVTELTRGTQWTSGVSDGLHITDAVYGDRSTYEIRCDVTGFMYGGLNQATFGALGLILLQQLASVGADDIDRESFKRVDLYAPTLALYQSVPISVAEVVRLFEKSSFSQLLVSAEGFWSGRFWAPADPDCDLLQEITDADMQADPTPESAPSTPLYLMVIRYKYQQGTDSWSSASNQSATVIGTHRTTNSQTLETALDQATQATNIADRYALIQNAPTKAIRFVQNGFSLINLSIFERFLMTMSRAQASSGSYSRILHELTEVTKTLNPPAIEVVAGNMQGLGNMTRSAAPNALAGLTYASASADQRARYGWACDNTTGRADVSDPNSFAQNRAW